MIRQFLKKLFKRHSPTKEWANIDEMHGYVEKDTECDDCEFLVSCKDCMECTTSWDSRRHYIPCLGGDCRKRR